MRKDHRYAVAIIGLGLQGNTTWHRSLHDSEAVTVSAVCDADPEVIERFIRQFPQTPAYTSLDELLRNHKPDFAIVCVPNRLHLSIVQRLEEAQVDCLKEKPIATTATEFRSLCSSSINIGVAFQRRWQERFIGLRNALPRVGKPISVRCTIVRQHELPQHTWRVQHNVGIFDDLGVHLLDVLVWLFGCPYSVMANSARDNKPGERDRESHVSISWPLGLNGQLHVSEVGLRQEETILVRGSLGWLELSSKELNQYDLKGNLLSTSTFCSARVETIRNMCHDFGDFITKKTDSFFTSIVDTEHTFATTQAIRQSFDTQRPALVEPHVNRAIPKSMEMDNTKFEEDPNLSPKDSVVKLDEQYKDKADPFYCIPRSRAYILNTGDQMPGLGFGTRKPKVPNQTYNAVREALAVGYRHIDTASRYNNEEQVGAAVKDARIPRNEIWITTKVDNSWHHRVAQSVDSSLQKLGMEYVDLLLMHWPTPTDPNDTTKLLKDWDFTMTWQNMQQEVLKGRVRNIGVSNFGIRNIQKLLSSPLCTIVPAVNQIELHPLCPSNGLVAFCERAGIHCTAYSPLASGNSKLHEHPILSEISRKTGFTSQQILILWGLQRGTSVIPKSTTGERIVANFNISSARLTAQDHFMLSSIDERRRIYQDSWLPSQVFWEEDQ
ncbi:Hypothetical protein R9X50_00099200 [Acrodontium crateriforme]|uniref:Uncharacterized protein n=1 Tax=Acrodontium crateriforme TaxID=150365 RepID=A0AAQ3R2F5_9PEZI|nr:Hypothetical protein R9X50_00099200 [Acrodontium crateriforme]